MIQKFLICLRTLVAGLVGWFDRIITPNTNVTHLSGQPTAILVRHGETESNNLIHASSGQNLSQGHAHQVDASIDTPLTPFGQAQAHQTAEYLIKTLAQMGARRVVVWVSPFRRALATAMPFLEHPQCPPIKNYARLAVLQEQLKAGREIPSHLQFVGVKHFEWPEYLERIQGLEAALKEELQSLEPGEQLVIFGHSLTFSLLISKMFGSNKILVQLPNCSISSARVGKYGWEILHLASIAHLPRWLISGIHTLVGSR